MASGHVNRTQKPNMAAPTQARDVSFSLPTRSPGHVCYRAALVRLVEVAADIRDGRNQVSGRSIR
jgi:hypothetical protein